MRNLCFSCLILLGLLAACSPLKDNPTPKATPTRSIIPTVQTATAFKSPEPTATLAKPVEEILIQTPGPGSRVVSPIRVMGMADSTFEQHLAARVLLDDGTELAFATTIIESELGKRGSFQFEIPFKIDFERQAFIQVFSTSPRDGGIVHLASVGVLLESSGESLLLPAEDHPELIEIYQPAVDTTISGGIAHIEGFALASFEQTLVAEVVDMEGKVISSMPLIVNAPDWGVPGPFSVDLIYKLNSEGPGRIVVRDPSPAFSGDVHLASISVYLKP